jgi:hypothetical protein
MAGRRPSLRQVRHDTWVLHYVETHPGSHCQQIADGLKMPRKLIDSSLRRLSEEMHVWMKKETVDKHLVNCWYSNFLRQTRNFCCRRETR